MQQDECFEKNQFQLISPDYVLSEQVCNQLHQLTMCLDFPIAMSEIVRRRAQIEALLGHRCHHLVFNPSLCMFQLNSC